MSEQVYFRELLIREKFKIPNEIVCLNGVDIFEPDELLVKTQNMLNVRYNAGSLDRIKSFFIDHKQIVVRV